MMESIYHIPKLHRASMELVDQMVDIAHNYADRGYRLTVRQLYYQLVSRNIVRNADSAYQRVSKLLNWARHSGRLDWEIIWDPGRRRLMPGEYDSLSWFVSRVKDEYRRPRWEGQKHYVEVMVEKDALVGVLEDVTDKYHVSLMANKGYTSASAMKLLSERLIFNDEFKQKKCHVLYLGDHDPSGIDMVRDVRKRLARFFTIADVERIALNMDQIKEHDLPPNPAKMTDPRSAAYVEKFGRDSWELDALDPDVLAGLVEESILEYLDVPKYEKMVKLEKEDRERLVAFGKSCEQAA